MATKSDRSSTRSLKGSSVYSIDDLDHLDRLPLIRHRSRAAPLKSFLLAAATLLVVLLTVIVVYLVVSLCLVQRQLTSVSRELTSASYRLDRVEKELLNTLKENHTSPEESNKSENTTATNLLMMLQRLSPERDNRKQHRVGKREASKPASRASDQNRKLRRGEKRSRRSSTSADSKSKKDMRDRQMRLVWKEVKQVRNEMESLRNDVAHPSALMVLPDEKQISNDDFTPNSDNAIRWMVDHNSLFDARDSTHLVVKTAGTYFIYLQITYNGQRQRSNPTCSHKVMLQNPNYIARHRPLLYGSSTQYKLGDAILYPLKGGEVKAIDTIHLSGVFHLTVGDRIYVKPDEFSHDCIVQSPKEKTFFGAFRLQSSFHEHN